MANRMFAWASILRAMKHILFSPISSFSSPCPSCLPSPSRSFASLLYPFRPFPPLITATGAWGRYSSPAGPDAFWCNSQPKICKSLKDLSTCKRGPCNSLMTFFQNAHFSTHHDARHATLTKNNTAQSFRNDPDGLNVHFLVQLFLCTLSICYCLRL